MNNKQEKKQSSSLSLFSFDLICVDENMRFFLYLIADFTASRHELYSIENSDEWLLVFQV